METIQVVLDSELLQAANAAAKRARVNRSALIREALREHLKRLRACEAEARDRRGYERRPDMADDAAALLAASRTYTRLHHLRGKVRFTRTLAELKADR